MNRRTAVLIAPLLATLTGCGTLLNGSSQGIVVLSEPLGAEVWTDESRLQFWAPTGLQLSRKRSHTLRVELPGYVTETVEIRRHLQPGIVALDVVLTGPIGVILDGLTGAWYALSPTEARVVLRKIDPVYAGRDSIEIRFRARGPGSAVVSSEPDGRVSWDRRP